MPRRNRTACKTRNNRGTHQRRRTTRGHRAISKFVKYKYYGGSCSDSTKLDTAIWDTISANN